MYMMKGLTDLLFWKTWRIVSGLFKAYLVTLVYRCFFVCFSGQHGTVALKLGFTYYEEHLCVVALTGINSARGAQTHPLSSLLPRAILHNDCSSSTFR